MHTRQTRRTNQNRNLYRRLAYSVLLTAASVSIFACNSDSATLNNDSAAVTAPVTEDTDQLVRSAMANIAMPLQGNYKAIAEMANSFSDSPPVARALKQIASDDNNDQQTGDESTETLRLDASLDIESMMLLLFDQENGATVQRSENTVTITPDDSAICGELASENSNDTEICTQYIQQFDMQINAQTDEAGTALLRFQQQVVVSMTYSPDSSVNTLRLQGARAALQYLMDLENEGQTMPEVMAGSIELSATVNSSQSTMTLAITDKVIVTDSIEQIDLSIDPSRVLFSAESGTESMEIDIEVNGLRFTEITDSGSESALYEVTLPAFTVNLQQNGDDFVKVNRFGFGKGPFQITVDDAEMIRLTMAQFGFQIDGDTGVLTIDQLLDFGLKLDNSSGALDEELPTSFNALFSMKAPSGTALLEQNNDTIKVLNDGPVSFEYAINDGNENPGGSFSAAAGECFTLTDQSEQIFTQVPCE